MYLINIRHAIFFVVNTLSQHMVDPRIVHCIVEKHIPRYFKGTIEYKLQYVQEDQVILVEYSNSYWVGSAVDRNSTFGCFFNLGSGMISLYKRKQKSVALSPTSQASCEALWLQKILVDLFDAKLDPTVIYCDNQSCIKLSKNPIFHDRSKHIEIRYHFIWDKVQKGVVKYVSTNKQVAHILTKVLSKGKSKYFEEKLGVIENTFLTKESVKRVYSEEKISM
jgi:hypothetical protein